MHKLIGISAIALTAALISAPSSAIDLNLGGSGPVVDLGTSSDQPLVTVETGPDTSVDIGIGSDGNASVDLSDTDDAVDLGTGDGDGIGLDFNDGDDNDLGLNLDNDGGDDVIVDLFGGNTRKRLADVNDEEDSAVDVDVLNGEDAAVVDVFGRGETTTGRVKLPTDGAVEDVDLGLVDADEVDLDLEGLLGGTAIPDLFGPGGTVEDGPEVAEGEDGIDGRDGRNGVIRMTSTTGSSTSGSSTSGSTTIAMPNRTRVAAAPNAPKQSGKCFTPDDTQLQHLVSSRTYSAESVSSWQQAQAINIVPVQLCPEAKVKVAEVTYGNSNFATLRSGVAATPQITSKLAGAGRGADEVLAVAQEGKELTVYIY